MQKVEKNNKRNRDADDSDTPQLFLQVRGNRISPGCFVVAPRSGIKFGFVQKEAAALRTLLSYYPHIVPALVMCGDFPCMGRKLAIYDSGRFDTPPDLRGMRNSNTGVLSQDLAHDLSRSQKLGRADIFLRRFMEWPVQGDLLLRNEEFLIDFPCQVFKGDNTDIAVLILSKFRDELMINLSALFHHTIENGNVALARHMLEIAKRKALRSDRDLLRYIGGDVGKLDSILYSAIRSRSVDMVNFALDLGADVNNVGTRDGATPLHLAIWGQHDRWKSKGTGPDVPVARLLLNRGADLSVKEKHGDTPLMAAEKSGCQKMIDVIREKVQLNALAEVEDTWKLEIVEQCPATDADVGIGVDLTAEEVAADQLEDEIVARNFLQDYMAKYKVKKNTV